MAKNGDQKILQRALDEGKGILRLDPAWVTRDFLPPGRRLRLADYAVEDPRRGFITERWLGSVTEADNTIRTPGEGLSCVRSSDGGRIALRDAIESDTGTMLGESYAKSHGKLGILTKFFDFAIPIPFHLHQMAKDAKRVNCNPKDEAYYFPQGVSVGSFPLTYFGLHRSVTKDMFCHYIEQWNSDQILNLSKAYNLVPGEGFLLPSGILHAPGTALTLEIQEDSDVFAMFQAEVGGNIVSEDLIWKDFPKEDRGNMDILLDSIDWETCKDPDFYDNHRTTPQPVKDASTDGGGEQWIAYGTAKFSAKKLVVHPGQTYETVDKGAYPLVVWQGAGTYGGVDIEAPSIIRAGESTLDELFVTHERATKSIKVENLGQEELVIFKFFGPDINPEAAAIPVNQS